MNAFEMNAFKKTQRINYGIFIDVLEQHFGAFKFTFITDSYCYVISK